MESFTKKKSRSSQINISVLGQVFYKQGESKLMPNALIRLFNTYLRSVLQHLLHPSTTLSLSSQGFCISSYISLFMIVPNSISTASKSSDCSATMPPKRRWYIQAPHALRPYYTDLQTFLKSNEHYTDLTVASFVFYPPKSDLIRPPPFEFLTDRGIASNAAWNTPFEPARLLLLQRNVTDASLSDLWEVPWGACKLMDSTILHSAKRVILDRTGLHTERLLKEIGKGVEFKGNKGLCLQLSFEIEIAEMVTSDFGVYPDFGKIPIKVDPGEHQDSVWVTKQDILDDAFPLVAHQSKDLILEAFRLRRKAEKQVRVQAILASRARKSTRYGLNYGSGSTDGSG